jgi:hypothetical protein
MALQSLLLEISKPVEGAEHTTFQRTGSFLNEPAKFSVFRPTASRRKLDP